MFTFLEYPVFKTIHTCCNELDLEAYAIGGYVRDIFLKRESKDIDIVTIGKGIDLATRLYEKLGADAHITVFKNFGTAQEQLT